jgi:hypothetical protein
MIEKGYYEKQLEAEQNKKKRFINNNENIPIYQRKSVSKYTLDKNPQYRDLFYRCVSCDNFSLKPINKNIEPLQLKRIANKVPRKCNLCGYIHEPIS